MKAKAGGLFQVISSFAIGKIKKEIQEDKMEVINTFKFMRFLATKIVGSRKKEESEESMKLTAEQQKEIKEGILRWETIITRITNTMVSSTTNSASSNEESSVGKEASSENSKSSSKESESSAKGESETSAKGESEASAKRESETSSSKTAGGSSTSATKEESSASQSSGVTVTQVEEETSKDVSTFIMNLEKKCPQKEEYKVFFEQLKGTMIAPPKERKGLFSRIKFAAGKLSGAMGVMRSRIGSKSAEVKKSMETYQEQVMKTLQELDTIHSQIVSQNQGKKEGSLTCTPAQQTQIKTTITKWEQVTTQFVETAIQSETKSSSTTSSSVGKMNTN
ncbi:hypothetical protein ISN44_As03g030250 [Arabidopsis suecica]|uniref:DUF1216 domain-containing protein n=1 Tax=Arabidopsis suecica TaxID=45249 RepID=A0A8T2FAI1_ARASU|nr:hypothetical protein ISN44_As03g030250 [Arabidopsis suecica]